MDLASSIFFFWGGNFLSELKELGGGFKYFYVHPEPWGRWPHFDDSIFQMGWFDHQVEQAANLQEAIYHSIDETWGRNSLKFITGIADTW